MDDFGVFEWQLISVEGGNTYRMKVYGGWVMRYGQSNLVFIPDAHHSWA